MNSFCEKKKVEFYTLYYQKLTYNQLLIIVVDFSGTEFCTDFGHNFFGNRLLLRTIYTYENVILYMI